MLSVRAGKRASMESILAPRPTPCYVAGPNWPAAMHDVTQNTEKPAAAEDNARDRHLFGTGPKRMLALDGGGVRGAITVAFLERIEEIIAEEQQKSQIARTGSIADGRHGTSRTTLRAGPSSAEPCGPAWRLVRSGRWHVHRRHRRDRAGTRQRHGADQGILPRTRGERFQKIVLARAWHAGEIRRPRACRRNQRHRQGPQTRQ